MPPVAAFVVGAIGGGATAAITASAVLSSAWLAGAGFTTFLTTTFVGKLLSTVAISALSVALQSGPAAARDPGIRVEQTVSGATTPASFVLGKYATEGKFVAPPMTYKKWNDVPNALLVYVIEVGDVPGQTLEGLMVNGEPVTIGEEEFTDGQGITHGYPLEGKYENYAWVTYYDGTQTTADQRLVDNFGEDPDRPWTADMVGNGICYAVVTFRHSRKLFGGSFPSVRFILGGIPLYDPRKDSTVGGTGAHRWDDTSTWEQSENPYVQTYNIKRGIELPSGDVWGGEFEEEDLPLSNWFAAMNAADAQVEAEPDVYETAYRSSYEVFVSDEPASVIEELLKASAGQVSEIGGIWKARCGGPGMPVYFFSDEDVNVRESQHFDPFPGITEIYNGVHASFPDPDSAWNANEAPPRYNDTYEAEDGGKRLVADLTLAAAPYAKQVQRLMVSYVEEERRMRRHNLTLAPDAIPLEPLDSVSWTSLRNGYTSKVFEVAKMVDPLLTSKPVVSLKERDSGDYGWNPANALPQPTTSLVVQLPEPFTVTNWTLSASTVKDGADNDRRPALKIEWNEAGKEEVTGITFEVRLPGTLSPVCDGTALRGPVGQVKTSEGIVKQTTYEARVKLIPQDGQDSEWSDWESVTTGNAGLTGDDFASDVSDSAVPTGLVLSTSLPADGVAHVVATWAAATGAVSYELGITEAGGTEVVFPAAGLRYEWVTRPNVGFSVRVRGVSALGKKSAWTSASAITSAADATPPDVPGTPALSPGFGSIWFEFTGVTNADLSHYEVVYKTTSTTPGTNPTSPVIKTLATRGVISGLDNGQTRYVFVRAVDTSGNRSAWSAGAAATTSEGVAITPEMIEGIVNETSFASGIEPVSIETGGSLPTVKSTNTIYYGGKLYYWDGSEYVLKVEAGDVIGQLVAGQIAAGAIGVDQLAAQAIVASKVGVGDFTNLWKDEDQTDTSYISNASATYLGSFNASFLSTNVIRVSGTAGVAAYAPSDDVFEVDPDYVAPDGTRGEQFWIDFTASIQNGTTGAARLQLQMSNTPDFSGTTAFVGLEATTTGVSRVKNSLTVPSDSNGDGTGTKFRYARVRLVKGGDGTATQVNFGRIAVRRKNAGNLVIDGTLRSNHLVTDTAVITVTAQIADAIISNAKISDLSAAKLTAGTTLSGSVLVSGTALSSVEARADDPGARINVYAGATKIDPGKITISGSTTLANWRFGSGATFDANNIEVGTVKAQALQVGLRGLNITGISFSRSGQVLSWTGGKIKYIDNNGTESLRTVAAGSYTYTPGTGVYYIYWTRGGTTLQSSNDLTVANTGENVVICSYDGDDRFNPNYGRTIIDGDYIATGSIRATHLDVTNLNVTGEAVFAVFKTANFDGTFSPDGTSITDPGTVGAAMSSDGDLVFNNSIARTDIKEGAITDGDAFWNNGSVQLVEQAFGTVITLSETFEDFVSYANPGSFVAPNGDVLFTVSATAEVRNQESWETESGGIFTYHVRRTGYIIQHATRVSGTWGSWVTIFDSGSAETNSWQQRQGVVERVYYDVEDVRWRFYAYDVEDTVTVSQGTYDRDNVRRLGLSVLSSPRR